MKKHNFTILFVVILGLSLVVGTITTLAQGGTPLIDWWVIAGGGGPVSNGEIHLNSTLGQPIVGTSSGANFSLSTGYWHTTGTGMDYNIYLPVVNR